MLTVLDAIRDPALFGGRFRDPSTWRAWFALLAALFALPTDAEALAFYRRHTQRKTPPTEPASEAWVLVCRRGNEAARKAVELESPSPRVPPLHIPWRTPARVS